MIVLEDRLILCNTCKGSGKMPAETVVGTGEVVWTGEILCPDCGDGSGWQGIQKVEVFV